MKSAEHKGYLSKNGVGVGLALGVEAGCNLHS